MKLLAALTMLEARAQRAAPLSEQDEAILERALNVVGMIDNPDESVTTRFDP
jgi:hypothetical protein